MNKNLGFNFSEVLKSLYVGFGEGSFSPWRVTSFGGEGIFMFFFAFLCSRVKLFTFLVPSCKFLPFLSVVHAIGWALILLD